MANSVWIAHSSNRENAKCNLLCFPFPGGSASYYANWSSYLSKDVNVCPVLYPMREKRRKEKMPDSIMDMVKNFVESNLDLFEKPFGIFGYCAGSVIAYEVIKYVYMLKGVSPEFVVVASANAPEFATSDAIVKNCNLNDNEMFIQYIKENKIFDESFINNPMFYNYYFPIMKEDYLLLSTYEYEVPSIKFDFPIYVAYGEDDHRVSEEKMKHWKTYTNGQVEIKKYAGDHFFVNKSYKELLSRIELYTKEIN